MEKRVNHPGRPVPSRLPPKRKKRPSFRGTYLKILAVLLLISAGTLIYVHKALKDYEAAQPENILSAQVEMLRKSKSDAEASLSLEPLRSEWNASQAEIDQFRQDFLASHVSFLEDHSAVDPETKTFHVLSNGCPVGTATLRHEGQKSLLLIFTLDRWKVEELSLRGYELNLTLPATVTVQCNGEALQGTVTDGMAAYDVRSLTPLNVTLQDVLGNTVAYDQGSLPSYTDYQVTIPADYTIEAAQRLSASSAALEPLEELKYVREYCPDLPDSAAYTLRLFSGEPDIRILDGSGSPVDFTWDHGQVTITREFTGQDTLPKNVDFDPLKVAKLWSLFMTQDLTGANNGYSQLSPYLIKGSYLQDVAWQWATGLDITFTSAHSLKDPPFQVEEISNYVVYSDSCFSCDIRLEKKMVLKTGAEVDDVIHSTFYFVKYQDSGKNSPNWVLVDYREIQE